MFLSDDTVRAAALPEYGVGDGVASKGRVARDICLTSTGSNDSKMFIRD
jgi:hypothetical protein